MGDPAVISEIDGIVKDGGVVKGQRKMIIVPDDGTDPREQALHPKAQAPWGPRGCRCTSTCTRASASALASS